MPHCILRYARKREAQLQQRANMTAVLVSSRFNPSVYTSKGTSFAYCKIFAPSSYAMNCSFSSFIINPIPQYCSSISSFVIQRNRYRLKASA